MKRLPPIALVSVLLTLAGIAVGCRQATDTTSPSTAGEEDPSLALAAGMRIRVTATVLGLGANLRRFTEDQTGIKEITVTAAPPEGLAVEWREEVREETEASRRRREAFDNDAPKAGVGEAQPAPPAPEYAVRVRRGSLTVAGLDHGREMNLPALWPDGEHAIEGGSLLWMSKAAFRELRSTRETRWSPGLLDSPLLHPAAAMEALRQGVEALEQRLADSESDRETFDQIEARADFGSFELTIDGERRQVRTIVAHNWFAEYVILDEEDNPLVLKVTLNPLSGGALDVFSPLGVLKSILGYQVIAIEKADPR